ncbi:hypothetical protein PDESU_04667 [Pontiella desulfatans]|uniref:PDZ domain-containing protein n=1 Tax=Pontiella desulfatans TaxID=2750659 RepID=A0A6C2U8M8_PONDE|nr:hypothetical protein [Pontiella desulfatans]VGO16077.1 hypothetical protein PDESU_04667 [Pontiella desulfatans]
MKTVTPYILLIGAALGMGAAYRMRQRPEPEPAAPPSATEQVRETPTEPEKDEPLVVVRKTAPPPPKPIEPPEPAEIRGKAPAKEAAPQQSTPKAVQRRPRPAPNYWEIAARRFSQKQDMLNREQNPDRRLALIQSMSANVRIDTPSTIDWAMGLEDPEERRVALEAINKNALVGIGARIHMDETGVPRIMDTTVLSAIDSTGMTQPGDYIVGIENGEGEPTYFKGQSMQNIVQQLRGQAGTEVNLIMERVETDDSSKSVVFNVPVQRSMIVVQPPF